MSFRLWKDSVLNRERNCTQTQDKTHGDTKLQNERIQLFFGRICEKVNKKIDCKSSILNLSFGLFFFS